MIQRLLPPLPLTRFIKITRRKGQLHLRQKRLHHLTVRHDFSVLLCAPVLENEIPRHSATPRRLILNGGARFDLCRQSHPHLLDHILRRMSIPQ